MVAFQNSRKSEVHVDDTWLLLRGKSSRKHCEMYHPQPELWEATATIMLPEFDSNDKKKVLQSHRHCVHASLTWTSPHFISVFSLCHLVAAFRCAVTSLSQYYCYTYTVEESGVTVCGSSLEAAERIHVSSVKTKKKCLWGQTLNKYFGCCWGNGRSLTPPRENCLQMDGQR